MSRRQLLLAALPAGRAADIVLVSGCSATHSSPQSSQSINVRSQVTTTLGMVGHATASAPASASGAAPAPTPAALAPSIGTAVSNNFAFVSATLTVPVGTIVPWTNQLTTK
ncbi:MAG: hypothetical protein JOZ23_17205 [Mycobacterium sp.]|nr:hypothetical protein [Mycobacterium sp.]MBV9353242.1 hypothetical protein [Mycobacterium sp.]